jgi:hypothetical protein
MTQQPSDRKDETEDFTLAELAELADSAVIDDDKEYRPRVSSERRAAKPAGPVFRDDFVLATTDEANEDDAAYESLLPPEGLSPAQRRAITAEPIPLTVEEEPQRPLTQFTMVELLCLMSFLCVGFSIMYYLPPAKVAGVLGLLALAGQGLLMRFPPENRHIRLAASVLLIMYGCAAVVAFVQHVFFPAA